VLHRHGQRILNIPFPRLVGTNLGGSSRGVLGEYEYILLGPGRPSTSGAHGELPFRPVSPNRRFNGAFSAFPEVRWCFLSMTNISRLLLLGENQKNNRTPLIAD
jgi:hypothetical protein